MTAPSKQPELPFSLLCHILPLQVMYPAAHQHGRVAILFRGWESVHGNSDKYPYSRDLTILFTYECWCLEETGHIVGAH